MPSFDIVSEVDHHELSNAVDQANREVTTRFDFKGSGAEFSLTDGVVELKAGSDFQLDQMRDILAQKLAKRGVEVAVLDPQEPVVHATTATQRIHIREGIETDLAKRIVKLIKESKMKVQAAIQGDQVRVTGKKRDDLQQAIALVRDAGIEQPLQYKNFRD